jgi:hypothetical protein
MTKYKYIIKKLINYFIIKNKCSAILILVLNHSKISQIKNIIVKLKHNYLIYLILNINYFKI